MVRAAGRIKPNEPSRSEDAPKQTPARGRRSMTFVIVARA
jgi:hypothetical protein